MSKPVPNSVCASCAARLPADSAGRLCSTCRSQETQRVNVGPWVPPEFWDTEEMREALASWHIGHVVAAYRHHPYHGQPLSQETVAAWVNNTQAQLSRLESGPPVKNLDKLWLWARTLRVPGHLLWFSLPGDGHTPRSSQTPVDGMGARDAQGFALKALPGGRGTPFLRRRSAIYAPPGPTVAADDVIDLLPHGAAAGALMKTLEQHAVMDNLLGPHAVLPAVAQEMAVVEHLVAVSASATRNQMLVVAARFAELAGWLHQDAGDLVTALQWSNAALEFAREAGDHGLMAYIWMRKSNIGSDMGQPQLALSYARAALRGSHKLPSRTRAVALRQAAHGHALKGDLDACSRALDQALTHAAAGDDADETDIARYCTPSYIEMEAAACWVELGQPAHAVTALQNGLSQWNGDFRRDLGLGLARIAVAYAANDQPDDAYAAAERSVNIATDTLSHRTLTQLDRVPQLLVDHGAPESAGQLRHMLAAFR